MHQEQDINNKLEAVKQLLEGLRAEEKDEVKSRLLSWLLFSGTFDEKVKTSRPVAGLTEKERALLLRLAKQAERLNRLLNDDPDTDQ
ncbi:MAG TPA: hypothetical protein VFW78_11630 [Bacteroidia bacterium]|nr:hypothetical protein [Bacteroidia bacterium]